MSPRAFKLVLGQFAPQFLGYSQHDSQELCNFVLDALHEDVNRVVSQPYIANFEADGQPDAEVAAEVLLRHRKRYDSHISDLFEGLFKSQVTCPACDKVSVTFDVRSARPLDYPYCISQLPFLHTTLGHRRQRDTGRPTRPPAARAEATKRSRATHAHRRRYSPSRRRGAGRESGLP